MATTIKERLRAHKRRRRWRLLRLLLTLCAVVYGLWYGWSYIHQPGLAFGSVVIHGTNQLTEEEIIKLAGSEPPFNFFNVSFSRLQDALDHDIRFQNAKIAYRWPAGMEVTVEEREPALYVANSYRSYLQLDYNGLIINVTTGIPDARAPLLVGVQCGNVFLGDPVGNDSVMQILKFLQLLDGDARDRIAEIAVDDRQEARLSLRGSFNIKLGPVAALPEKAPVFMTVFNEIKNKNIQAEYIDLTFAKPYIKLMPEKEK